jgi:hypothetical protein
VRIWVEILAGFLSYAFVGWVFVLVYLALQWFMQATDVTAELNWSREGNKCHPIFDIRNHSKSKTYRLADIAYTNGTDRLVWFDNKSLMGKEMIPGGANEFQEVAPVRNCASISECLRLQVTVRLQTGRRLWLEGQGSKQEMMDRLQRAAIKLRTFIDGCLAKTE